MSYNRKIVIFENIAGQGYQPVLKTRARLLKIKTGNIELLKTLRGGQYLSAYGRKMGKNTFWYAKGPDGYLYNVILDDLDAKMGILDINPIDRDMRMFHTALDRLADHTYGKTSWLEKHTVHIILFLFLITLIVGMYVIAGKIGEATAPYYANQERSIELTERQSELTARLDGLTRALGKVLDEDFEVRLVNDTGGLIQVLE